MQHLTAAGISRTLLASAITDGSVVQLTKYTGTLIFAYFGVLIDARQI